ncbi:MAG: 23S rRNA (adenine(2503)-C(2))-methyltransferase RlmN [Bacteroidales bacterium]
MKKWLIGNSIEELNRVVGEFSFPNYRAAQIAEWIYKKRLSSIEGMTTLSKEDRELLSSKYEVGGFKPKVVSRSIDGTAKYLFPSLTSTNIEAVTIPSGERLTLCLSTQAGCRMGCKFCMTARMGFKGDLSAGEIVSQFLNVEESSQITNIVYMGMGEPLDNIENVLQSLEILTAPWGFALSPRRITLSTIGIYQPLKRFLEESECHLAISLHNPFPKERASLMAVQNREDIHNIVELIRGYNFSGQRRVSFEYILFSGWNDTKRHADAIVNLLRGIRCRVNLIRYHSIPNFPFKSSPEPIIELFKERLSKGGILTTVRASRGEDILAACGLLNAFESYD